MFRKPGGVSLADGNLRKDKAGKDGRSHIDTIRYLPIPGAGRAGVTLTSGRLFTCPREVPTENVLTKTSIYFSAFPSGNHTSFTTNFHSFPATIPLGCPQSLSPVSLPRVGSQVWESGWLTCSAAQACVLICKMGVPRLLLQTFLQG